MLKSRLLAFGFLVTLAATPAFAQDATPTPPVTPTVAPAANSAMTRDINQQQRIEQGLQSGQLTTGEAAKLENGEKRIDNAEAHALKTGDTPAEQAHIQAMENKESAKIYDDKHNAVTGDANSASSQRMQGDVQRDVNQQTRINNGVANGSLTNGEAARLEHGQARDDRAQAAAGKNGNVSAKEQARLERKENRKSGKIWRAKHNRKAASDAVTPAPAPAAAQ